MKLKFFEVEVGVKGEQAVAVICAAKPKEFNVRTIEDDPNVEELFAVDTGDDANDGIFKQVCCGHEGPLLQRSRMWRSGLPGIGYRRNGSPLETGLKASRAAILPG